MKLSNILEAIAKAELQPAGESEKARVATAKKSKQGIAVEKLAEKDKLDGIDRSFAKMMSNLTNKMKKLSSAADADRQSSYASFLKAQEQLEAEDGQTLANLCSFMQTLMFFATYIKDAPSTGARLSARRKNATYRSMRKFIATFRDNIQKDLLRSSAELERTIRPGAKYFGSDYKASGAHIRSELERTFADKGEPPAHAPAAKQATTVQANMLLVFVYYVPKAGGKAKDLDVAINKYITTLNAAKPSDLKPCDGECEQPLWLVTQFSDETQAVKIDAESIRAGRVIIINAKAEFGVQRQQATSQEFSWLEAQYGSRLESNGLKGAIDNIFNTFVSAPLKDYADVASNATEFHIRVDARISKDATHTLLIKANERNYVINPASHTDIRKWDGLKRSLLANPAAPAPAPAPAPPTTAAPAPAPPTTAAPPPPPAPAPPAPPPLPPLEGAGLTSNRKGAKKKKRVKAKRGAAPVVSISDLESVPQSLLLERLATELGCGPILFKGQEKLSLLEKIVRAKLSTKKANQMLRLVTGSKQKKSASAETAQITSFAAAVKAAQGESVLELNVFSSFLIFLAYKIMQADLVKGATVGAEADEETEEVDMGADNSLAGKIQALDDKKDLSELVKSFAIACGVRAKAKGRSVKRLKKPAQAPKGKGAGTTPRLFGKQTSFRRARKVLAAKASEWVNIDEWDDRIKVKKDKIFGILNKKSTIEPKHYTAINKLLLGNLRKSLSVVKFGQFIQQLHGNLLDEIISAAATAKDHRAKVPTLEVKPEKLGETKNPVVDTSLLELFISSSGSDSSSDSDSSNSSSDEETAVTAESVTLPPGGCNADEIRHVAKSSLERELSISSSGSDSSSDSESSANGGVDKRAAVNQSRLTAAPPSPVKSAEDASVVEGHHVHTMT